MNSSTTVKDIVMAFVIGLFVFLTVVGLIATVAIGVHAGHVENVNQLKACTSVGGSWIQNQDNAFICVMPGLDVSSAQGLTVTK